MMSARYALGLLLLVYISNFIDRQIVGIIAQPMKEELRLTDAEVGLLGGLAFAVFYSTLGIPIARLAERRSRVAIIAGALAVWSAMTALCGLAQNFGQLLLARIGVGIGEAGCTPPAQSLIADLYPPERRATALSIYALGIPIGTLIGALLGGMLAEGLGWRAAFFALGVPGLLLAVLVRLTLPEPPRGRFDPPAADAFPALTAVARTMLANPAVVHMAIGASICSFVGYGVATFAVPFLLRGYALDLSEAATAFGLLGGIAAAIGTGIGGWLADRGARHDPRWTGWVPALGALAAGPLLAIAFGQHDLVHLALLVAAPTVVSYLYLGPTFAVTANAVGPRMRATAIALLLLVINLVGLGLGPLALGHLSDLLAADAYAGSFADCHGAATEVCRAASFAGLRDALQLDVLLYVWAAWHFWRAATAIGRNNR